MITIKNTRFRLSTMSVESFSRKELSVSCFSFAGLLIRSANHPFRLEFRSRAVVFSPDLTPSVPHKTGYYIIPDFGFPRKYKTVQSLKALKKLYSVYKKHLSFSTYQRAYFRNFAHFRKSTQKAGRKRACSFLHFRHDHEQHAAAHFDCSCSMAALANLPKL